MDMLYPFMKLLQYLSVAGSVTSSYGMVISACDLWRKHYATHSCSIRRRLNLRSIECELTEQQTGNGRAPCVTCDLEVYFLATFRQPRTSHAVYKIITVYNEWKDVWNKHSWQPKVSLPISLSTKILYTFLFSRRVLHVSYLFLPRF